MNPRILVLGRTTLLLAAVLTLALFFARPTLPVTQAEKPPIENAAPAQGFILADATVHCDAGNMVIEVTAGNPPFTVSGTGPNLPPEFSTLGTYTIDGAGSSQWQEIMVTSSNSVMLGDVDCTGPYIPLRVDYHCTEQELLWFDIRGGDGLFTIRANAWMVTGRPAIQNNIFNGPLFSNVIFEEEGGDHEVLVVGDMDCTVPSPLSAWMSCDGQYMHLEIRRGNPPFQVTGTGPELPLTVTSTYSNWYSHTSGTWENVTVTEINTDHESLSLGSITCPDPATLHPLTGNAACHGFDLSIWIGSGDDGFFITGTGPGLPIYGSTGSLTLPGPGVWTGVTITENSGDHETLLLGDFDCSTWPYPPNLVATTGCVGNALSISIGGDPPYLLEGNGPSLPLTLEYIGVAIIGDVGPGTWTGMIVTELGGDREQISIPDISCPAVPPPTPIAAQSACLAEDLMIRIFSGDFPILIQGTGPELPRTVSVPGFQFFVGTGGWTDLTLTELSGDGEQIALPNHTCPPPSPPNESLSVRTGCTGEDGWVNVESGDGPFVLEGSEAGLVTTPDLSVPFPLNGPATWSDLVVRELGGDQEVFVIPPFTCPISTPNLQATMTCDGSDLMVDIQSGDPFFSILGFGPGLPFMAAEPGVYRFSGPGFWKDLTVQEPMGDPIEVIYLGMILCGMPIPPTETPVPPTETPLPPPPAPIVLPEYVPEVVMQLSAATPQIVYDAPNGEPIHHPDGSLLMLPQDSDGSGADTYLILDAEMVDDVAWVGVYLGGPNLGWLPLESLTVPE